MFTPEPHEPTPFSSLWLARVPGMSWTPALLQHVSPWLPRLASCRPSITAYYADDSWHCRASVPDVRPAPRQQQHPDELNDLISSSHPITTTPILACRNTRSTTIHLSTPGWLVPTTPQRQIQRSPSGPPSSALVSTPLFSLPASAAAPNPFLLPGTSLCSMSQLPPCPSATPLFSSPRLEPPPWERGIRNAGTTSNHNVPSPPSHTCVVRLDRSRFRVPRRALYLVQHQRPGSTSPASLDVRLTEARWVMPKAASQRGIPSSHLPRSSPPPDGGGAPQSPSKNKAARPRLAALDSFRTPDGVWSCLNLVMSCPSIAPRTLFWNPQERCRPG